MMPDMEMNLILMGPPGSGKGTQGSILSARYGIPHLSTGDMIRTNIAKGTELGQQMKQLIDNGNYVDDAIVNEMIRTHLAEPETKQGFILDGYPRTLQQVGEIAQLLSSAGRALTAVILLEVGPEETIPRLLKRAGEQGRKDDTADVIQHRVSVYEKNTAPLVGEYEKQGLLHRIDGEGSLDEVTERIVAALP